MYGSVRGVPGDRHSYRDPSTIHRIPLCISVFELLFADKKTKVKA
jgi:hypothetical protein